MKYLYIVASLLLQPTVLQAEALSETALQRALGVGLATRKPVTNGLPLASQSQIVAERDNLCLVTFVPRGDEEWQVDKRRCYSLKGSYETRQKGVSAQQRRDLYRHLGKLNSRPDAWAQFKNGVLQNSEWFPVLQDLVLKEPRGRQLALQLWLYGTASFIDKTGSDLRITRPRS